jgi:nucleoside phosphorylase
VRAQPWYVQDLPDVQQIDENAARNLGSIDVLLVTATNVELQAVLHLTKPLPQRRKIFRTFVGPETYYIGKYGHFRAVITMCRPGSVGDGAAILAVDHAIQIWQPRVIIMVGIARTGSKETKNR